MLYFSSTLVVIMKKVGFLTLLRNQPKAGKLTTLKAYLGLPWYLHRTTENELLKLLNFQFMALYFNFFNPNTSVILVPTLFSLLRCLNACNSHWYWCFEATAMAGLFSEQFFWALPPAVAVASRPRERRYAADSLYRTSGRGPGWASAFWVISISNNVLTSDSKAPPRWPSFSGVLPEKEWEVGKFLPASTEWKACLQ